MKICELSEKPAILDEAIQYFWQCWGNEYNFKFYDDCIRYSINKENKIPKFYIGLESDKIVGSYALITNDLISRQDLYPWFACLYVNETHRKRRYAELFLEHGLAQAKLKGFESLYLSSKLVNFYEKKGWTEYGKGYGFSGDEIKIYCKPTI